MTDNIRYYFTMLLLLTLFSVRDSFAQGNTVVRDFNDDKSFDFLVRDMAWLDVESWDYVLTDGKTGKRWGYASSLYYVGPESFISPAKIRNELPESWDKVIRQLEDTLIQFRSEADPSLQWILESRIVGHDNNFDSMFDRAVIFNKEWYAGTPYIAENYTYMLGEEASEHFDAISPFETYYWVYRSHNHKENPASQGREDINVKRNGIIKTKHALLEIRDNKYAWIFISGVPQTGGPSKLRWPSIEKFQLKDGLIFMQQQVIVGEYTFWIGDLERNVWGRISNENFEDRADFRLENGSLVILDSEGDVNASFSLSELKDKILSINQ